MKIEVFVTFLYGVRRLRRFGYSSLIVFCFLFDSSLVLAQELSGEKTQNKDAESSDEIKEKTLETQKTLELLFKEMQNKIEKEGETQETKEPALEIDGLIMNETKTKIGRDFYDYFFTLWVAPPGIQNYTIFIIEKPLGVMGSLIWVKINDTFIYGNKHKPSIRDIENGATSSVNIAKQYLLTREENEKQLSGQDLSGNGIF